jgi:hypothetical protein
VKQIVITVDKTTWERFDKSQKTINPNRDTINDIVECFQRSVDIEKKSYPPELRIVGKEKPKETKQDTSNLVRIGPPPTDTGIKINIENELYKGIVWAADKYRRSVDELATEWATDYIDVCLPEVSDVTKAIYAGLGLGTIELLK